MGMSMLDIPVKLIVKAPNQQVEDQTIHCSLSWTIKRLKGHLSEVYPSKPNTEDQRLIYYGQLLNDSVILKDVFTRYEAEEETHTVHLVCMPSKESLKMHARKVAEESSKKAKETNESNASTSQRSPSNENGGITSENRDSAQIFGRNYMHTSGFQSWINGINSQPLNNNYIQQWAWMQQVYANYYMSQYMEMVARQNTAIRDGQSDPRQTEAAHNPEPQLHRDAEQAGRRLVREWVDFFYTTSRLLILLGIIHFYSSPSRFFIVSFLGLCWYLYQRGLFGLNQNQAVQNNNEAVNNNIPVDNNNVIPQEEAAGAERGEVPPAPHPNPGQRAEAPENPSFITLTWTFLTSFFSSMIPETQNAL